MASEPVSLEITVCATPDAIRTHITETFPYSNARNTANTKLGTILKRLRRAVPDTADARAKAMDFIAYVLGRYDDGRVYGGKTQAGQDLVARLINDVLCLVGLPADFGTPSLTTDGEAVVVTPTTDTTIVTESEFAGVDIDPGDVSEPTLITITRLPDDGPGPLLTPFDQYPLYYEFHGSTENFTGPITVGVCQAASITPPDPSRLRLAHMVAPYTYGSIEVLPLAPVPFLDCTNAELAAVPGRGVIINLASAGGRMLSSALAAVLGPQALHAATAGSTGIGGSVRTFSPFAAIDTLGHISDHSRTMQYGPRFLPARYQPTIGLHTPTGQPMPLVPVTWTLVQGTGSITPGTTLTGANGRATSLWTYGAQGPQQVRGTPVGPPGTGFTPSSILFKATAQ